MPGDPGGAAGGWGGVTDRIPKRRRWGVWPAPHFGYLKQENGRGWLNLEGGGLFCEGCDTLPIPCFHKGFGRDP